MRMIILEIEEIELQATFHMKLYDEFKFQNSQEIQRIYIEIEQKYQILNEQHHSLMRSDSNWILYLQVLHIHILSDEFEKIDIMNLINV